MRFKAIKNFKRSKEMERLGLERNYSKVKHIRHCSKCDKEIITGKKDYVVTKSGQTKNVLIPLWIGPSNSARNIFFNSKLVTCSKGVARARIVNRIIKEHDILDAGIGIIFIRNNLD